MSKKILTPDELLKTSDELNAEAPLGSFGETPPEFKPLDKPRKFRDPYNYNSLPKTVESNYSPSLTIQNDSFTLKELLERNSRGLSLTSSGRTEIYHGDQMEMPDLQRMDISEIHDLAQANQNQIKSYRDLQLREAEAAQLAKERKLESLQKEVEAFRAKYPATTSTDGTKPVA